MANNSGNLILAGAGGGEGGNAGRYRGGLFRLGPGDDTWQLVSAGLPDNAEIRTIVVHPNDTSVIFVGTQDGPYRSTDRGKNWEKLGFPDRDTVIWTIAVHPTRPNVIYAGAAPVALYQSDDSGDNWRRIPRAVSPAHCEREGFDTRTIHITIDPLRPDDIYAGLEVSGVIRSSDAGETWHDVSASLIELAQQPHLQSNVGGRHCGHCEGMLDTHALAISTAAPGSVFLGVRMGIFRSDDSGGNWYDTNVDQASPLTYCRDVIVSPHDPRVFYACLSEAAFSKTGSLYRSDDVAQTWQRFDHGVKATSTVMAVTAHPSDPASVCCVTRGGQVLATENTGASWEEFRLPSGVHDVYAVACI